MNAGFIRNREGRIIGRWDGQWLRDGTGKLVARLDELTTARGTGMAASWAAVTRGFDCWTREAGRRELK